MLRLALLVMVAGAACGGDDTDPHAVATCNGWTDNQGNPYTGTCEAACTKPPPVTGLVCDTPAQLNCRAFSFSDSDGCCVPDATANQIKFVECTTKPKGQ